MGDDKKIDSDNPVRSVIMDELIDAFRCALASVPAQASEETAHGVRLARNYAIRAVDSVFSTRCNHCGNQTGTSPYTINIGNELEDEDPRR